MSAFAPVTHVEAGGARLAVRRAGSGPPLLLIHGIPTSSRLWDGAGAILAAHADVIAPDLLGYGGSDKPLDRDVSIAAQAGLLVELLDTLGVERATVCGHDIGGGVAQILAVRNPDRVAGLALIDSVSFDSWPIPQMRALSASAPVVARLPADWVTGALMPLVAREVPEGEPREALGASLAAWSGSSDALRAFLRNVEALDSKHTEAVADDLGRLDLPVHLVWGARDAFQPPQWAVRLRDAIPGATLRLEDGGHFLPWDEPAAVARELRRLLARVHEGAAAGESE